MFQRFCMFSWSTRRAGACPPMVILFCLIAVLSLRPTSATEPDAAPADAAELAAAELAAHELAAASAPAKTLDDVDLDTMKRLVVKLDISRRQYDLGRPWVSTNSSTSGTGVLIGPGRVLTNAHVVIYGRDIRVQPAESSRKYDATLVAVSHELDLAVVQIDDEQFDGGDAFLPIAEGLPQQRDDVSVYGFPIGGETVSVTEGIVSRMEYASIAYGGRGFRIQVDAALNPGNSGGPVVINDQLAGIVTSGIRTADNIGYLIAAWEIKRFLKRLDEADPVTKQLPQRLSFHCGTISMENDAQREFYRLPDDRQGRLITVTRDTGDDYPLKVGDIITAVAGLPVDNDGKVQWNGRTLQFAGVARLEADEQNVVAMTVYRDGESMDLEVPLTKRQPRLLPHLKGESAEYFIYGPLSFVPANETLITSLQKMMTDSNKTYQRYSIAEILRMSRWQHPVMTRSGDSQAFEGEQIVLISLKHKHRLMRGVPTVNLRAVDTVNGIKIRNLRHLADVLREMEDEFVTFQFGERDAAPLIVKHDEMMNATLEVMEDNSIRRAASTDLSDAWPDPE